MNNLFFLEKKDEIRDFPLTNTSISDLRLVSLIFVSCAYFVFNILYVPSHLSLIFSIIYSFLPIVIYFFIYYFFTKESPIKMYKKWSFYDLKIGIVFLVLQLIYVSVISRLVPNMSTNETVNIYSKVPHTLKNFSLISFTTIGNLMLEEIFSIIIFIALFKLLSYKFSRETAIGIALVLSSIVFGLMHFQAYNWHLAQMILLIGGERLFLTGAYIRTKNIWTSFLMHYIFDMAIFLLVFLQN
ncbi:CPBP family intramembrane metalloprotease [Enterococcus faecalis]|uniref:CPBP family intramembrane glutamic endopeptidase n=1 Tax=Enterococcus faecalis TaxID=1351 RepID=UPI0018840E1B|nr:CPBP family intramembrane glutamic endopeptidase [Enterococcus faecalis]MBF0004038.1 CPBP family intramembrane metalloprotease [Enterococcus faecalis]MBF0006721.1 CPBP family intramembrane metalloprotease [Enterococcus faecalis]